MEQSEFVKVSSSDHFICPECAKLRPILEVEAVYYLGPSPNLTAVSERIACRACVPGVIAELEAAGHRLDPCGGIPF